MTTWHHQIAWGTTCQPYNAIKLAKTTSFLGQNNQNLNIPLFLARTLTNQLGLVQLSSQKTLFTDAWIKRHISFERILGIARLMEIDLEPLHLLEVLEAAPTQEPGTPHQLGLTLTTTKYFVAIGQGSSD